MLHGENREAEKIASSGGVLMDQNSCLGAAITLHKSLLWVAAPGGERPPPASHRIESPSPYRLAVQTPSMVLFFADCQIARQKAILFTKSARL